MRKVRAELQQDLDAAVAADGSSSAGSRAATSAAEAPCTAAGPPSPNILSPEVRLLVHRGLNSYEKVKTCSTWDSLRDALEAEDDERLKELFRLVHSRGYIPRSKPALAHKIVEKFQKGISSWAGA